MTSQSYSISIITCYPKFLRTHYISCILKSKDKYKRGLRQVRNLVTLSPEGSKYEQVLSNFGLPHRKYALF